MVLREVLPKRLDEARTTSEIEVASASDQELADLLGEVLRKGKTGTLGQKRRVVVDGEILSRVVDEPRSGGGVLPGDDVVGGSLLPFL
ncbi:MAG: hypothetical protein ACC726_10265 [Chloroflexota bacterium]